MNFQAVATAHAPKKLKMKVWIWQILGLIPRGSRRACVSGVSRSAGCGSLGLHIGLLARTIEIKPNFTTQSGATFNPLDDVLWLLVLRPLALHAGRARQGAAETVSSELRRGAQARRGEGRPAATGRGAADQAREAPGRRELRTW